MGVPLRTERPMTPQQDRNPEAVRIMIVDDSLTVRTVFSRMIQRESDMEIVASAGTAERALVELRSTPVDVILLDLEMPGMGGLEALPKMLATAHDAQVLVVSSLTAEGAEHTLTALSMGAADTMLKPRPGGFNDAYRDSLLAKIRALGGKSEPRRSPDRSEPAPPAVRAPRRAAKRPKVVAIGASTGGIHALNLFLRRLPAAFDLPILITQHLPDSFIPVFARQMEMASGRPADLAGEGTVIARGRIVIAPGNGHMIVRRQGLQHVTGLVYQPVRSGCMPSVDPMFESLASAYDGQVAAVLLSGMGRDGTEGAQAIAAAGGTIFAQDAESCAVWGMPRTVAETGLAAAVLPPEQLADRVAAMAGAEAWQ